MNDWLNLWLNSDYGTSAVGPQGLWFIILLGFLLGHIVGFVYMWTHESLSYSRTFVTSLVVLPPLVAVMMTLMAGSLLVAFGLLAVFGVIRFRNVLKDTRDTVFVLWGITEGMGIGTMRYSTASVCAVGIAAVLLYLRFTSFGTRNRYDTVVTLRVVGDIVAGNAVLKRVLQRHALRSRLVSAQWLTDVGPDVTYHLLLRDPARSDELQDELAHTDSIENVSVFVHTDEAEI
jgi:hypothetical protein